MTPQRPKTELDARYSSALNPRPGAENVTATDWAEAQSRMRDAEVFWITTVRPDGRLHVTPLIAAWHDGALHFSTGPGEQKAKNLAGNAHCALTTGHSSLSGGLDIVVEGTAEQVTDAARQDEVIAAFEAQYGGHITSPEGAFFGFGDSIHEGRDLLFAVAPITAYGFGHDGQVFSHTRYTFWRPVAGNPTKRVWRADGGTILPLRGNGWCGHIARLGTSRPIEGLSPLLHACGGIGRHSTVRRGCAGQLWSRDVVTSTGAVGQLPRNQPHMNQ